MKKALFPGTFDPPTLGHLDLIRRASQMVDTLSVGIAHNIGKEEGLFSVEERVGLLKEITKDLENIEIVSFTGLVVEYLEGEGIDVLIRGIRPFSNLEHEFQMALANRKMSSVETVFLMAGQSTSHISSTLIREIGHFGHRLHNFVPEEIEEVVFEKLISFQGE